MLYGPMHYFRTYQVSDAALSMSNGDAYTFCEDQDRGLAMWDTADSYEDMKYLSTTALQGGNSILHLGSRAMV